MLSCGVLGADGRTGAAVLSATSAAMALARAADELALSVSVFLPSSATNLKASDRCGSWIFLGVLGFHAWPKRILLAWSVLG